MKDIRCSKQCIPVACLILHLWSTEFITHFIIIVVELGLCQTRLPYSFNLVVFVRSRLCFL